MNSVNARSAGGKIFKTHSFTSRAREEGKAWLALEGSSRHVHLPQPCHTLPTVAYARRQLPVPSPRRRWQHQLQRLE